MYSVCQDEDKIQIVLYLSTPSPFDIIVRVSKSYNNSRGNNATASELYVHTCVYCVHV